MAAETESLNIALAPAAAARNKSGMQDNAASRTALATAYMRAAHQILDGEPLLFPDPVALPLLGPDAESRILSAPERFQSPYGRGLRSHVCLRARFAEDVLAQTLPRWYVLVGAGFDTFALRQPEWAKDLRIVEVDHPATQAAKHKMTADAGFTAPHNLTFAATDFTRETLGDVLGRLAIAPDDSVYFSWLGVSMYLSEAAVDATLAAMAKVSEHVRLTMTFKQPLREEIAGDVKMMKLVASIGEPFTYLLAPDEMAAKLSQHGFVQQEFLTGEIARARYFTPPRRGIPAPHHTTIVTASK